MRFLKALVLASIILYSPTLGAQEDLSLPNHFSKPAKERERGALKSPFSKRIKREKKDRKTNRPSDPFGAQPREKGRSFFTNSEHYFAKPVKSKTGNAEGPSAFSAEVKRKKRRNRSDNLPALGDAFSKEYSPTAHDEDDLFVKVKKRGREPKYFVGEKPRLFSRDPNRKKQKLLAKKKANEGDAFKFSLKSHDRPQMPKGQSGLFENGVLPKMKDSR